MALTESYSEYCKTVNVSTPLMLAKLATQLLSLNFVDAKQCGTAHAQSKTNMRGQNDSRSSCTMYITLP